MSCDALGEDATRLGKNSVLRQPLLKDATKEKAEDSLFPLTELHMLPDFTKAKSRANRDLLRSVRKQIPAVTPLIQGVATFNQHEGKVVKMVRADDSEATIDYRQEQFEFALDREETRPESRCRPRLARW